MIKSFANRYRLVALAAVTILIVSGAHAAELTPAIHAADIDTASCAAYLDGKLVGSAPAGSVEAALGIAPSDASWKVGPSVGKYIDYRIGFRAPVAIGTILTSYSSGRDDDGQLPKNGDSVSYLKADAPYPGDVTVESQWVTLGFRVPSRLCRSARRLAPCGSTPDLMSGAMAQAAIRYPHSCPERWCMSSAITTPSILAVKNLY